MTQYRLVGEPSPDDRRRQVEDSYGLTNAFGPGILKRIMTVESGGNLRAVSPKGAMGAYQFMPATAKRYDLRNPFNEQESEVAAAKYLKDLITMFDGDTRKAIAAYNAGEANVKKYDGVPPFSETQEYVRKILGAAPKPSDGSLELNSESPDAYRLVGEDTGSTNVSTQPDDEASYKLVGEAPRQTPAIASNAIQSKQVKELPEDLQGKITGEMRAAPSNFELALGSIKSLPTQLGAGLLRMFQDFNLVDIPDEKYKEAIGNMEKLSREQQGPTGVIPTEGTPRTVQNVAQAAALGIGPILAMVSPQKTITKKMIAATPILLQEYENLRQGGAGPLTALAGSMAATGLEFAEIAGASKPLSALLGRSLGTAAQPSKIGKAIGFALGSVPGESAEEALQNIPELWATQGRLPTEAETRDTIEQTLVPSLVLGGLGGTITGLQSQPKAPTDSQVKPAAPPEAIPTPTPLDSPLQILNQGLPNIQEASNVFPQQQEVLLDPNQATQDVPTEDVSYSANIPERFTRAPNWNSPEQLTLDYPFTNAPYQEQIPLDNTYVPPQQPESSAKAPRRGPMQIPPIQTELDLGQPQADMFQQEPTDDISRAIQLAKKAKGALPKTWVNRLSPILSSERGQQALFVISQAPKGSIIQSNKITDLLQRLAPVQPGGPLGRVGSMPPPQPMPAPKSVQQAAPEGPSRAIPIEQQAPAVTPAQAAQAPAASVAPTITKAPTQSQEKSLETKASSIASNIRNLIGRQAQAPTDILFSSHDSELIKPSPSEEEAIQSILKKAQERGVPPALLANLKNIGVLTKFPTTAEAAYSIPHEILGFTSKALDEASEERAITLATHELGHALTVLPDNSSPLHTSPFYAVGKLAPLVSSSRAITLKAPEAGPAIQEFTNAYGLALSQNHPIAHTLSYPTLEVLSRLKNRLPIDTKHFQAEAFAQMYSAFPQHKEWIKANMPQTYSIMEAIYGHKDEQSITKLRGAVSEILQTGRSPTSVDQPIAGGTSQPNEKSNLFGKAPVQREQPPSPEEALAKKFATYIAQGIEPAQSVSEQLTQESEALWNELKKGIRPHADTDRLGNALAAQLNYDPAKVLRRLRTTLGRDIAIELAMGINTSRYLINDIISNIGGLSERQFVTGLARAMNVMAHTRAVLSSSARALSLAGWYKRNSETIDDGVLWAKKASEALEKQENFWTEKRLSEAFGGPDKIARLKEALTKHSSQLDRDLIEKFLNHQEARMSKDPSLAGGLAEYWRAMALTGFQTWSYNLLSSLTSSVLHEAILKPIASLISKTPVGSGEYSGATRALFNKNSWNGLLRDVLTTGYITSMREYPINELINILEIPSNREIRKMLSYYGGSRWDTTSHAGIGGSYDTRAGQFLNELGAAIRTVGFTPMAIGDSMVKAVSFRIELQRLLDKGMKEEDAIQDAIAWANKVTFNEPTPLIDNLLSKAFGSIPVIGTYMVPFVKAVANTVRIGWSLTPPGAIAKLAFGSATNEQGEKSHILRQRSKELDMALTNAIFSGLLFAAVAAAIESDDSDKLLALGPRDYSKKLLWEQGNIDLSIPIGNYRVSLERLDPSAIPLAIASLASYAYRKARAGQMTEKDWREISKVIYEFGPARYFTSNITDSIISLHDGDWGRWGANYLNNTLTTFIPFSGLLSQLAQATDTVERETNKSLSATAVKKIPGLRQELPPKLSVMGEDMPTRRGAQPLNVMEPAKTETPTVKALIDMEAGLTIPPWVKKLPYDYQKVILKDRAKFLEPVSKAQSPTSQKRILESQKKAWGTKWSFLKDRVDSGAALPSIKAVKERGSYGTPP